MKVTVGVVIDSLAVNVMVTTSSAFATVLVELFDARPTLDNVGAVESVSCTTATSSIKIVPEDTPAVPLTVCTLSFNALTVPDHAPTELKLK